MNPGEFLQRMLPLYGLTEAGDYWWKTFTNFHICDSRMEQKTGGMARFFHKWIDRLLLISATHVNDTLQACKTEDKQGIQDRLRSKVDANLLDK